ncbi:Spo0B C-terminal domain-containing protein [Bacillus sp. B15-48]|uniref:Spo0B C-terminal domain-containing protein n=1 Tax=Bacillus sp. B15-48 TaxID=1548601 RepID=UPI00193EF715|nr:Spo0B C-terminal domain-containing protein [Bacillus sp. B15-48]MBM4762426.1 sporulation protein [Bacillus sp. B15-48]
MKKEWDTLEVLKHARHDWLNKLQLIKGNLSLNKVDRVKEIIEEIILDARQETMVTNLNLPQFASTLLTCNWEQHYFLLDYEVADFPRNHKLDDQLLSQWLNQLFEVLDKSIEKYHENHLSVTIQAKEEEAHFFFDFSGLITNPTSLFQFLEETFDSSLKINVIDKTEEELSFEVFTNPS